MLKPSGTFIEVRRLRREPRSRSRRWIEHDAYRPGTTPTRMRAPLHLRECRGTSVDGRFEHHQSNLEEGTWERYRESARRRALHRNLHRGAGSCKVAIRPSGFAPVGPTTPGLAGFGASAPMIHMPLSTPFVVPDGITASALLAMIGLRRGQPQGPANDQDVEEFIYDAVELLPGAGDVEVRCEGGRVTLSGSVPHKRLKRDVGEIAWAIPGINDVQNTIGISTRRRSRAFTREGGEAQPGGQGRKQS